MDPQTQFKERYEAFVKSRESTINKTQQPLSKPHRPFNKFYLLGLLIGAFIVLPVVFVLLRNNVDKGTPVVPPTSKQEEKQISEDEIYQELVGMVGSDAKAAQDNPQLVKQAKNNILKRRALQKISSETQEEQEASIASLDTPQSYSLQVLQTELGLEKAVVTSRTADYVSTYVAPDSNYEKNAQEVQKNLEYIKSRLDQGRSITQAYQDLIATLGQDPQYNLVENAYITKDSGYSSGFTTTLLRTKEGVITPVIISNKTDFMVAKITKAVNTAYSSLKQWEEENL